MADVELVDREAAALVGAYGRRAQQIVVDAIVAAIRDGDDAAAAQQGEVLRAVERLQRAH